MSSLQDPQVSWLVVVPAEKREAICSASVHRGSAGRLAATVCAKGGGAKYSMLHETCERTRGINIEYPGAIREPRTAGKFLGTF